MGEIFDPTLSVFALGGPTLHVVAFAILFTVAILQWVIIVPLASRSNVLREIPLPEPEPGLILKPFTRDIWFILWNLIPIIMLTLYAYIWYHWGAWTKELSIQFPPMEDPPESIKQIWNATEQVLCGELWLIAALALAFGACIAQRNKHKSVKYRYWWDKRTSPLIFNIRLVALWFNMMTVVIIGGAVLQISVFLTSVSINSDVQSRLFHPDGVAGMGTFGLMTLAIATVCLVISGMGVVAFIDHRGQHLSHRFGDSLLVSVAFLVGVWMLAGPPIFVHRKVMVSYNANVETLSRRIIHYQEKLQPPWPAEAIHGGCEGDRARGENYWCSETWDRLSMAERMLQRPRFPINLQVVGQMVVSWLAPLIIYLGRTHLVVRKKEEDEGEDE